METFQRRRNRIVLIAAAVGILLIAFGLSSADRTISSAGPSLPVERQPVVAAVSEIESLGNGAWRRSFRAADGTIYLRNRLKTVDGGKTVTPQEGIDVEDINGAPERAVLARPGLFFALGGPAEIVSPGVYSVNAWRSTDELKTLQKEVVTIYVPAGPTRPRENGEWYGLYVYRTIVEMPSGSWLMTMEGNLAEDTLTPQDANAQLETTFMMRSLIVESTDQGRTWHYLSSIAVPRSGDPVGEGFVEPAIALLDDGRLLSIMRTGHHFPLYASWSADGGRTWTPPVYTGLDRGCDPCLIKLADGRVALSWGRRYPEGWSTVTPQGDQSHFTYPGEGYTNLAVSDDGGATWTNQQIAKGTGSCYSTIFEVEPNVLFFQVDGWYWRVTLVPRDGSGSPSTTTTAAPIPKGQQFSDVSSNHPYYAQIADLATRAVTNGFPDGTFRPDNWLTRQQFAKMIVKTLGLTVTGNESTPFGDVGSGIDSTDPFYPDKYVAVCAAQGITKGKTASTFAPYDNILRQQLITMVARAAGLSNPSEDYIPPFLPGQFYPDEHYLNARKAAYAHLLDGLQGVGSGYGFLSPATRGEVCVLLYNLLHR